MYVLIIIDMQVASFEDSKRYDADGVVKRINLLSDKIRKTDGKVIFIQHVETDGNGNLLLKKGGEILPSLIRHDSDLIIRKTICDSFYKTDLNKILTELGTTELIVTGCATDFCVDTTIRSAISQEYNLTIPSDCHTTADRPHLKADEVIEYYNWLWKELIVPQNKRIEVVPCHMVLESI